MRFYRLSRTLKDPSAAPMVITSIRLIGVYLFLTATLFAGPRIPRVDHTTWDALLREFVNEQYLIDYAGLKQRGMSRLNAYVHGLRETGGEVVSADERKAILINAYNALTIRWVVENYPTKSIQATSNPFRERRHTLGGASLSLDEIEELLRETGDLRIHSALVCASLSCPPLRREAYVGSRINEQLNENTREWLANTELNRFDPRSAEAEVSSIFSWYEEDFATYSGGLEGFLRHYGPPETMAALGNKRLRISFLSYHWGLNDQSDVGKDYSFFELAIDWVKGWFR